MNYTKPKKNNLGVAIVSNHELDFIVDSIEWERFGIEVKTGNTTSQSLNFLDRKILLIVQ